MPSMPRTGSVRQRRRRDWSGRRTVITLAIAIVAAGVLFFVLWPRSAPTAITTLTTPDFHSLAFHPTDPDVVFFGHHNGIMRSADGGRTWTDVVAQRGFDAMSLATHGAVQKRLYLAGHLILQRSDDGGATWRAIGHDLPSGDIHAMAVSRRDPDRLYAFVVGQGLFRSNDGGNRWIPLSQDVPPDVMSLAVAGSGTETLYAGSMRNGLLVSRDGGKTWEAVPGLRDQVLSLAADPSRDSTVYAGRADGLFKTTDGRSWTRLTYPRRTVVAVTVSPSRPQVVLAVGVDGARGLVYRSEDGGASWWSGKR